MTQGAITKEVAEFLTRHVDSVAHLELLLLLYESNPKQWGPADVARELRIEHTWAAARLEEFSRSGIAREESSGLYRYAPKNENLRQVIQAVANAYSKRRVAVIDFIYSKPLANLRVFAESFRIRNKQSNKDNEMVELVYFLCAATSLACAILLARGYIRSRARLLLWSALCFGFLAINNALLVVDLVILPQVDLSLWRLWSAVIGVGLLIYGLIWEVD